jgi:hypothetical protein
MASVNCVYAFFILKFKGNKKRVMPLSAHTPRTRGDTDCGMPRARDLGDYSQTGVWFLGWPTWYNPSIPGLRALDNVDSLHRLELNSQ